MDSPRLDRALRFKTNSDARRRDRARRHARRHGRPGRRGHRRRRLLLRGRRHRRFTPVLRDVDVRDVTSRKSKYAFLLRGYARSPDHQRPRQRLHVRRRRAATTCSRRVRDLVLTNVRVNGALRRAVALTSPEVVITTVPDGVRRQHRAGRRPRARRSSCAARCAPATACPPSASWRPQIGVSRPTVRAGLHALAAMGVVRSRHGSGTFIPAGPPALGSEPLSFLAALHGFTRDDMYEARRMLEVESPRASPRSGPRPSSWRRSPTRSRACSPDRTSRRLFSRPRHQLPSRRRRRPGNPILAALIEMVSAMYYERRKADGRARRRPRSARRRRGAPAHLPGDPRATTPTRARRAMHDHLLQASRYQAQESGKPAPRAARRRKQADRCHEPRDRHQRGDNVATALEALEPGPRFASARLARRWFAIAIPRGHKVALARIPAGQRRRQIRQRDRHGHCRHSAPARTSTRTTSPAARGRGDLAAPAVASGAGAAAWPSRRDDEATS